MESIKDIIKVGQKVTSHKSNQIGIMINEKYVDLTVDKVNKKSFIAGGIKFNLWKVIDRDSYGHRRKDGKQEAIFTTPGRIDGIVCIEF